MSRRQKPKKSGGTAQLRSGRASATRQVEHLVQRNCLRDALKQARFCHRQDPSAENRALLERVVVLRTRELMLGGMMAEAKEVVGQLLALGGTYETILADLLPLLLGLGLNAQATGLWAQPRAAESQAKLREKLSDYEVRHPSVISSWMPELREGPALVREALSIVQGGDETRALELLQIIPRSSPMADWRYFVRGLAAFQRGDMEQSTSNWERLDPTRSARRIATMVQAMASERMETCRPSETVQYLVFGAPLIDSLDALKRADDGRDAKLILAAASPLFSDLKRIDLRLARRLTEALIPTVASTIAQLSYKYASRLIDDFTRIAEPFEWDPWWNRLRAVLAEGTSDGAAEAASYWQQYIDDLDKLICALPVERPRFEALIWQRIGRLWFDEARDQAGDTYYSIADICERQIDSSEAALRRSLQLDPTQIATHQLLVEMYREADRLDDAMAAARDFLQRFPDEMEVIGFLVDQYMANDDPQELLSLLDGVKKRRVLDSSLNIVLRWAHQAMARHHALAGQWALGREDFDRSERIATDRGLPYLIWARRAVFELKAGDESAAQQCVAKAESLLADPAPLWLAILTEAARYKLPRAHAKRFRGLWKAALKKRANSKTAGQLAELMIAFQHEPSDSGPDYLDDVVVYIRRTTRIRYDESDLTNVCLMLSVAAEEWELINTLAENGLQEFPSSPAIAYFAAEAEMTKGPFRASFSRAKKLLELSRAGIPAEGSPLSNLIPLIKRRLTVLTDIEEQLGESRCHAFGENVPQDLVEFLEETAQRMLDGLSPEDLEPEYQFVNPSFGPPSGPPPSRHSNRRRNKDA